MSANLTIRQAQMVLPNRIATGDIVIENGIIVEVAALSKRHVGEVIDGSGLTLFPGLIDGQVQFGEPESETFQTGTRAAAAGGVTSILEMPRYDASVDSVESLQGRRALAATSAHVHYGMYFTATQDNISSVGPSDGTCGAVVHPKTVGVFEHGEKALDAIFRQARVPLHFVAEDPVRLHERHLLYPTPSNIEDHPRIHDPRTAADATATAAALAISHGIQLHFLQVSSEEEIEFLTRNANHSLRASASLYHLLMNAEDTYPRIGDLAHTVPPIRSARHQHALKKAIGDGTIQSLTSGHCPNSIESKDLSYPNSVPGMPGVEWSLSLCLDQVHKGAMSLSDISRLWCEGPAKMHRLPRKGRLEVGFDGDVVLVDCKAKHTITAQTTYSKCGWTPWEGIQLTGRPVLTVVSGQPVFRDGEILNIACGKALHYAT